MIKGSIAGVLGVILLNLSLLSAALQAITCLVQSVRYNTFVFFGGWDWLQWTLIGFGLAVLLLIAAAISVARD